MVKATSFAELIKKHLPENVALRGQVMMGQVMAINDEFVTIDVGLKSEGKVSKKEFLNMEGEMTVAVGDKIEVVLDRMEGRNGEAVLSRDKARKDESWAEIAKKHKKGERVIGRIVNRVRGGFSVNINGVIAFLPGSQVDVRSTREKDLEALMDKPETFVVVKMDDERDNIVVSRRQVIEEDHKEKMIDMKKILVVGAVVTGKVKNLTNYGAFIDLGLIDGLLHVGEMSWKRINHPSDILSVGDEIKVKVITVDKETNRVSLSVKALENNPWVAVAKKYKKGQKVMGTVTNLLDYGAFISLEPGVEGLAHISELSWTKRGISPAKLFSLGQEVEVMVLDIDNERRRLSLGLKQCTPNPLEEFANQYKKGAKLKGAVKNITEFGIFVGLSTELDGMVHASDISWEKTGAEATALYQKGQEIEVILLDKVDLERGRISLGIKQLTKNPVKEKIMQIKKDQIVTATVIMTQDNGIEVDVNGLQGFIARVNLAKDKADQRIDRFAVGERVDAQVTAIDKKTGKLTLSIKLLETREEKEMIKQYGSQDSGASLGDMFNKAMEKKGDDDKGDQANDKTDDEAMADSSDDEADDDKKPAE
ncbi:MAG: 30S ribosomal protein S1 [Alphaproteobacteria bacterium]